MKEFLSVWLQELFTHWKSVLWLQLIDWLTHGSSSNVWSNVKMYEDTTGRSNGWFQFLAQHVTMWYLFFASHCFWKSACFPVHNGAASHVLCPVIMWFRKLIIYIVPCAKCCAVSSKLSDLWLSNTFLWHTSCSILMWADVFIMEYRAS